MLSHLEFGASAKLAFDILYLYFLSLISTWINEIVEKYPYLKNDYLTQKEKTLKFITGEIMKISKGQANPILTNELIEEILRKN